MSQMRNRGATHHQDSSTQDSWVKNLSLAQIYQQGLLFESSEQPQYGTEHVAPHDVAEDNNSFALSTLQDQPAELQGSLQCPFCEFRSCVKRYMDAHVRVHAANKRSYPCTYCPYVGAQLSNLKSHMRTHTGERPFTCSVCNRKFSHHHKLHNHYKAHPDWQLNLCPYCKANPVVQTVQAEIQLFDQEQFLLQWKIF